MNTISCTYEILNPYEVVVTSKEEVLYRGGAGALEKTMDSFWRDWAGFSHTVRLQGEGPDILLLKKWPLPGTKYEFILSQGEVTYEIREGDKYRVPDLVLEGEGRKLSLTGEINRLAFALWENGEVLCEIRGIREGKKKIYCLSEEPTLPIIGAVLVLDNLYHDY